ncbi:MAG TPA: NusG domain II-containing protein [Lachnospiraceae bacterium]|nr:NusG domain II-containing protein [Lachnospiraceae bacterium]
MTDKNRKAKIIGKKDLFLGAVLIMLAVILLIVFRIIPEKDGSIVRVKYDGEIWGEYPLAEDTEVEIKTGLGRNVLHIEDGKVWMTEADCPDGYCVEKGKISRGNEVIVCLPHRLTAEIVEADEGADSAIPDDRQVDIVAQ